MEELKSLQKELQQICKPLQSLSNLKVQLPNPLERCEKALDLLPGGEIIGRSIDEWRSKIISFIDAEKQRRKESFGGRLNQFIRNRRDTGLPIREFSATRWRVGPFEINFRYIQSQVKYSYNEELIKDWTTVTTVEDLESLYSRMETKLKESKIPRHILCEALWETYEYLKKKQEMDGIQNYRSVLTKDMIKELRVVLYRYFLNGKISRLKDESQWVFQYNLDLYFDRPQDIPEGKRISRESGSQNEIRQGKGLKLNGLNANDDYKVFCYFRA